MKNRIYSKILKLVRIEEVKDEEGNIEKYLVQSKENRNSEWKTILDTISLKKAIQKKHFQVLIILRDLGYRTEFLQRRKRRKDY